MSVPFFDALGQVLAWYRSRDPAASWENNVSFNVSSALAFVDHALDNGTIGDVMASLPATIASVVSISALTRWFLVSHSYHGNDHLCHALEQCSEVFGLDRCSTRR